MLYEEMILGSLKRPQAFFTLHDPGTDGTCALGAIYDARGLLTDKGFDINVHDKADISSNRFLFKKSSCPECYRKDCAVYLIVHLNNDHRWTRERIALEYLKPIEEAYAAQEEKKVPEQVSVAE